MKNIILQHWTGGLGPLELASKENIEKYSELRHYCFVCIIVPVFIREKQFPKKQKADHQ